MADDPGQTTTDKAQRTKRKYTVRDKVRAAKRLNLKKAIAVDTEIRYRSTERRRNACRANLLIGRQSPNYKPYVRHGLWAVDLRESATQVGETQEEYERHMELVESVLSASRIRRSGNATGCRGWAKRCGDGGGCLAAGCIRKPWASTWNWRRRPLDGLCPASVRDLSFSTADLFADAEHPRLERTIERLDKRLVRVGEAYLTEYAKELIRLGVWGKHHYREGFLDQPPEVIGNALLGASEVKRRKGKGQNQNPDMKSADLFDWDLNKLSEEKSALLAEWVRQGYRLPDPRREEDFALHLRLIEAAYPE